MTQTRTTSGLEAARHALESAGAAAPLTVLEYTGDELRKFAPDLLRSQSKAIPTVVILRPADHTGEIPVGTDVAALRWLYPGGYTPLVLVPSTVAECQELALRAVDLTRQTGVPVLLLLEPELAGQEADLLPPDDVRADVAQVRAGATFVELDRVADDNAAKLEARLAGPPEVLQLYRLDAIDAAQGRAEWLVVSYGFTAAAAQEAVRRARTDGQRVNHLVLQTLWPFLEGVVVRAAMGIRHAVVPERNLGQYSLEIRRVLPDIAVIGVNRLAGPVTSQAIYETLRNSPRCC